MNDLRNSLSVRLDAHGIEPNRLLGQHFLVDTRVLERIVAAAGVTVPAAVLEIGAGPGQLTEALLRTGAAVTAIEKDTRFGALLAELNGLRLIQADARDVDLAALMPGDRPFYVVGNLPYYVTTDLIEKCLVELPQAVTQTFLIQTEAARRLLAGPGSKAYGPLNILIRRLGSAAVSFHVPSSAFMPPPHVGSALLTIRRTTVVTAAHMRAFRDFLARLFSTRRKTVAATLKREYDRPDDAARTLLAAGIAPSARVEGLPPETLLRLFERLHPNV